MDKHPFTFSELHPSSTSTKQPYTRFLIFIKKRRDVSQETFHAWWRSVHADLAVSVAGFGGHCSRYVQMHTTPEYKDELKKHGMEPMQWDGMGEMHVKSIEDWVKFQGSPAFEKLVHDGGNFMDGPIQVMAGYDHLIYGSRIETSGGRDGILPGDERLKSALKGDSKL
ncbi:hypothetical protein BU26DRAFT_152240 [Trematosphaeria pertusa]|uniref:EthD domain-containing protein n=1 Tax=Trematosphaeria pertusa TaxID=390896 RepID=A0A6A6IYS7_9PLEO|nr:uncharacterized protein BU26DRAFT_152240 [Trematosphaeria pertusa]KAF2255207.1 hypothetical protein BU26DRAFT_152240 [Trematosphaeria pertusa]